MLGTLCTLITALSYVSGVTVVTQKPPVLSVSKGETATMDCNVGTVTGSSLCWHKQVPGGAPQFVLYFHLSHSSPTYGAGFSSSRFTSKCQTNSDCQLIINSVEAGDSAVYYCSTWDNSMCYRRSQFLSVLKVKRSYCTGLYHNCITVVFGQGTKLIVSDSSLPAPVVTLLPPSSQELKTDKATLVCLAKISIGFADVSWTSNGTPVTLGVVTSSAIEQADKTFGLSSLLRVEPSEWDSDRFYSCKVSLGAKSSAATIRKSECGA